MIKTKYRTKMLAIEAFQYQGEMYLKDLPEFLLNHTDICGIVIEVGPENRMLRIDIRTGEDSVHSTYINVGGWLVLDILNEFSTWSDERFRRFYK